MDEAPIFRASKKRKLNRVRPAAEYHNYEVAEVEADTASPIQSNEQLQDKVTEDSMSTLVKARKQKSRQGVVFSNLRMVKGAENSSLDTATTTPHTEEVSQDIPSRFTSGTGHVVDIDQHMCVHTLILPKMKTHPANKLRMAYIDSQMAKQVMMTSPDTNFQARKHDQGRAQSLEDEFTDTPSDEDDELEPDAQEPKQRLTYNTSSKATMPLHGQPAPPTEVSLSLLPPSSLVNNSKKQKSQPRRPRKPRLGRDGKPFRPRPRKRANSTDQARDRLVEQILSENKPIDPSNLVAAGGVGAGTSPAIDSETNDLRPKPTAGMNPDADEQLAAEFRRQFIENAAERRIRAQNHNRAGGSGGSGKSSHDSKKGNSGSHVSDGPKLGGSRSARAKMYAARMAEKEKDKEGKI